jgi:hypothetical protein
MSNAGYVRRWKTLRNSFGLEDFVHLDECPKVVTSVHVYLKVSALTGLDRHRSEFGFRSSCHLSSQSKWSSSRPISAESVGWP